jgi:hypothetical protein
VCHVSPEISDDIPQRFQIGLQLLLKSKSKLNVLLAQPLDISEGLLHLALKPSAKFHNAFALELLELGDSGADGVQVGAEGVHHRLLVSFFLLDADCTVGGVQLG